MGLDINGLRLQIVAKRLGADFKDLITIGRQELHLTPNKLKNELTTFNIPFDSKARDTFDYRYSESFFSLLGAETIHSIDNSGYENATIIHDMNYPLPDELKGKFSAVVDAGTLEHVFNYPVALKNCMELLKSGGVFISITPTNNFMGHGFYQFSPELFFSVFTERNGFELIKVFTCEAYEDSQWYEVSKPKGGNSGRVTLINHSPTYLMCIARRLEGTCSPFTVMPQQSDYVEAWGCRQPTNPQVIPNLIASRSILLAKLRLTIRHLPSIFGLVRMYRYLFNQKYNKRDYAPVDVKRYQKP